MQKLKPYLYDLYVTASHILKKSLTQRLRIYLYVRASRRNGRPLKLHLGCGHIRKDGWVNIDADMRCFPDVAADITRPLPFPNDTVDEIECCHLFEHLTYAEATAVLTDWRRVLKKGGTLSLELPDFDKCVKMFYSRGDPDAHELALFGIYGQVTDNKKKEYQIHKHCWVPSTLISELEKAGFRDISEEAVTQTWRKAAKYGRDMRFRCAK
jgi:predicted SAM-dependent methyltransferase